MTLRIDKIEIQEQPERRRFWAEVEVLTPGGFRRKLIMTPGEDGYWGILQAIGDYCDEFAPKPAQGELADLGLDALRAEVEAAGVRVDKRWGEARLREIVASVERGEASREPAPTGD